MSDDTSANPSASDSPLWPLAKVDGRQVVALDAEDVTQGRLLLGELEKTILHALDFMRMGDMETAKQAAQTARAHVARWAGELGALEEQLSG